MKVESLGRKDVHKSLGERADDRRVWWDVDVINRKLTSLRLSRKLTDAQLATRSGIPVDLIAAFERGERMPDSTRCIALAAALDVDVERLFKGDEATFRDFRRRGGGEVSAHDEACIEVLALERLSDHVEVMELLGLPLQPWRNPPNCPVRMATPHEAEAAAVAVRTSWDPNRSGTW